MKIWRCNELHSSARQTIEDHRRLILLEKKKWLPIAAITIIAEIILVAIAAFHIAGLNMLPDKYLVPVVIALFAVVIVTALLLFMGLSKKPSTGRRVRRIIAIVLAAVLCIGSIYATLVTAKVDETVDKVTEDNAEITAMMGVYVMKSDRAKDITDCKNYLFGVINNDFDAENTKAATDDITEKIGSTISTTGEASVEDCAAALYNGNVNALILNESYASILADADDYADFSDKTKILYEIPIKASDKSDNTADGSEGTDVNVAENPFIFYISGSDTRSEMLATSRSDVNILMVVNPKTKQILLLNTPRDYYVPNPVGGGALDKLTHCGIYGINCSMKALNNLYGCNIDYYMQINFTGFEKLIDSIGGITVDVPEAFSAGGYSYTKGPNQMDGAKALAFARERHAFASGDNERGQDQMRVIEATIQKLSSSGTTLLTNYSGILNSLQGMFITNMPSEDIDVMVKMQLNDGSSWNVKKYAVTGSGGSEYTYSMPHLKAYVMYQNKEMVQHASDLIDKVENGETLTDADVSD